MLILFVTLTVGFQAPVPAWETVALTDGSHTVEMPARAKSMTRDVPNPKGTIKQTTYFCRLDGALYTAQVILLPAPVPRGAEGALLDRELKAYIGSNKGKVVREEAIKLDEHPGREVTLEGPAPRESGVVTTRTRLYLVGRAYYFLTVMSARDRPLPEEAGRFLGSLRLAGSGEKPGGEADAGVAATSPEGALRTFQIALLTKDEATLRAVTLPTDDFAWLLKGQVAPPGKVEAAKAYFADQSIKALKPGDTFTLPGNRNIVVKAEEVTTDRAVLVPEGAPIPTRCHRVEGRWRVDATAIIAGRKAADAAARKKGARREG